ncbi:unnamed protein product [Colias eurytheme]|nr:unnamed protein product [Colias eurytheme]
MSFFKIESDVQNLTFHASSSNILIRKNRRETGVRAREKRASRRAAREEWPAGLAGAGHGRGAARGAGSRALGGAGPARSGAALAAPVSARLPSAPGHPHPAPARPRRDPCAFSKPTVASAL